jgi:hypothetical protein
MLASQSRNGDGSYSACPTKTPAKLHTVSHALIFKVKHLVLVWAILSELRRYVNTCDAMSCR